MKHFCALLAVLAFVQSAKAADTTPLYADVSDIKQYTPKAFADAKPLLAAVAKDPRFLANGAHFLFGLSFSAAPSTLPTGNISYPAVAMMADKTGHKFYRKFAIEIGGSPRAVENVTVVADIPLSQMHFQATTGLIDRAVLVEDVANAVTLLFPLGVGGLDEGLMGLGHRILTPQYSGAWIDRATVIASRSDPAYYRNEPFMPITNKLGVQTPIAFHITILSDDDWQNRGPNYLVRGFESHACMRLRLKDLRQFFTIVMEGADSKVPVSVDYFVWNRGPTGSRTIDQGIMDQVHPYPLEENSYMRVKNFALPGQPPQTERDPDENLLVMELVNTAPNLLNLRNFSADDITDLKDFDGLATAIDKLH